MVEWGTNSLWDKRNRISSLLLYVQESRNGPGRMDQSEKVARKWKGLGSEAQCWWKRQAQQFTPVTSMLVGQRHNYLWILLSNQNAPDPVKNVTHNICWTTSTNLLPSYTCTRICVHIFTQTHRSVCTCTHVCVCVKHRIFWR